MSSNSFTPFFVSANANTTVAKVGTAIGSGLPALEGVIHSVTVGSDTAGGTLVIRDGGSGGAVVFRIVQPANAAAFNAVLDVDILVDLWISTAGFAAPAVTVTAR